MNGVWGVRMYADCYNNSLTIARLTFFSVSKAMMMGC